MQKNIGTQEAYVRIAVAVVILLLALFVTESPIIKIVLALLAAVLAGTAFLRSCPLNTMLKRNTYDGAHEGMEDEIKNMTQGDGEQSVDMAPEPSMEPDPETVMEPEMKQDGEAQTEMEVPEEHKVS